MACSLYLNALLQIRRFDKFYIVATQLSNVVDGTAGCMLQDAVCQMW